MDEADSPRGRIHLMKAVTDGKIPASPVVFEHLDRCLVCRACEPACPSGVQYHDLIEAVRPQVAQATLGKDKRMKSATLQFMVEHVLPYPKRAAAAMAPLAVARKIGLGTLVEKFAPGAGALADAAKASPVGGQTSRGNSAPFELPAFTPARGKHRGNVVLLRGCVGSVLSAAVNRAAVRVITENGYDVHLLASEPCCGALPAHANDPEAARRFAIATVEALEAKGGDYFVSPIAGCGAQLKALHHVLAGIERYEARAKAIAQKVRDISEFLLEVGLRPPAARLERTVTYHDPCHLAHAQRLTDPPRQLLALIPGLQVRPLTESDMCCGAAGTYSMNQPAMATALGRRKVAQIRETGATEVLTANIGCTLQITRHLQETAANYAPPSPTPRVRHVIELLAEAYTAEPLPTRPA
jgi:glycolate oxidase iron-sulfur subunit